MKSCPFCGEAVEERDLFCHQCGKSLVQNCPNCGETIDIDALFCRECGIKLDGIASDAKGTTSDTAADPDESKEEPVKVSEKVKKKKPLYKKWWVWLCAAAAVLGLVLLFSAGGDAEPGKSKEAVEEGTAETDALEENRDPESGDIHQFRKETDAALKESFGEGYFETNLDEEKKLYNIYVWLDGGKEAMEVAREGDEADETAWNSIVGQLLIAGEGIKEKLDEEGLSDWSVTLSLLDEETHDEIYAISKDGYIYYEILKDGPLDT